MIVCKKWWFKNCVIFTLNFSELININDYEIVLPGFRVSVPRKKGPLRPEISHKNSDHIRLGNIEMVRQGQ